MTNAELAAAIVQTMNRLSEFPAVYFRDVRENLSEHLAFLLETQRDKIIAAHILSEERPDLESCGLTESAVHHMEKQLATIRAALNS